ncbi:hypothetical protein ABZV75_40030, partial [Streptomyces flaveolus]|uniref:hypothetical protein n=1 Tax=Streptomyces flaveolus TaxID=67297 RepID=UPI00339E7270
MPSDAELKARIRSALTDTASNVRARVLAAVKRAGEDNWHDEWPVAEAAKLVADRSWFTDKHTETLRALTAPGRRAVMEAAVTNGDLAELLHHSNDLLEVLAGAENTLLRLAELDKVHLYPYRAKGALDTLLKKSGDGRRELIEALESDHPAVKQLPFLPQLLTAANDFVKDAKDVNGTQDVQMVLALGGSGPIPRTIDYYPELLKVLKNSSNARAFRDEWSVARGIQLAALFADLDHLPSYLKDRSLRERLRTHSDQAVLLLSVPEMLRAELETSQVIERLHKQPLLVDVLEALPAVAARLAGDPRLLEAATENDHVARALSLNPKYLDATTSTEELLALLRNTEAPRFPSGTAEPAASKWDELMNGHPALHALVNREPGLDNRLRNHTKLIDTLIANPGLLSQPHEYRRLLDANEGLPLVSQLVEGSVLLLPGVLRAALRHRPVRGLLTGNLGAGLAKRVEVVIRDGHRDGLPVGEMLYRVPAFAYALSGAPTVVDVAVLAAVWSARPTDERVFVHSVDEGVVAMLKAASDKVAALDLLLRDDAALLRLTGGRANYLPHLTDERTARL